MFKSTQKMKTKANGLYALNGNNFIDFKENSKAKVYVNFQREQTNKIIILSQLYWLTQKHIVKIL